MRKTIMTIVLLVFICLTLSVITFQSWARDQQNPPSNQPPAKPTATSTQGSTAQQDFSKNTWNIPADADKTKNPVEPTEQSIAAGKEIYMTRKGNCIFCHGDTGAGNEANLPKLRRKPADLSDSDRMPKLSDGELYWKITKGIQGIMPGYDDPKLTAEERWHVVNFIRTLAKAKPKS